MIIARFGEECLIPDGAEYYIADVHLPIDDLACRYLLAFGNKCVCLEPEAMRAEMRKLAEEIYCLILQAGRENFKNKKGRCKIFSENILQRPFFRCARLKDQSGRPLCNAAPLSLNLRLCITVSRFPLNT